MGETARDIRKETVTERGKGETARDMTERGGNGGDSERHKERDGDREGEQRGGNGGDSERHKERDGDREGEWRDSEIH